MIPSSDIVKKLESNQVFVFGSNEAGRHGRGAAFAAKQWGARNGVGVGLQGQTYAIPTKDRDIETLPLSHIREYVEDFTVFAKKNPQLEFLVTRIGCGLAGYKEEQIAPFFTTSSTLPNVRLPQTFIDVINKHLTVR